MEKIGHHFMEKTKYKYLGESDQEKGFEQPPLELEYDNSLPQIELPDPKKVNPEKLNIRELIEKRRSTRKYSDEALTLEELSYLLWTTQGVKGKVNKRLTLRTVPSAGARHPLETYLLINNVGGLEAGLYRYLALEHKLLVLSTRKGLAEEITAASLNQKFVKTSAATFIWVAVPYRTSWRYGERAYRYIHLDAGHVCQNLYLSAEAINSGVCAIAAYSDDELNEILGLDGESQFVIYMATVGKK